MPTDVTPWLTAFSAYSIWTSLPAAGQRGRAGNARDAPDGEKVVRENEYCELIALNKRRWTRQTRRTAESGGRTCLALSTSERASALNRLARVWIYFYFYYFRSVF